MKFLIKIFQLLENIGRDCKSQILVIRKDIRSSIAKIDLPAILIDQYGLNHIDDLESVARNLDVIIVIPSEIQTCLQDSDADKFRDIICSSVDHFIPFDRIHIKYGPKMSRKWNLIVESVYSNVKLKINESGFERT